MIPIERLEEWELKIVFVIKNANALSDIELDFIWNIEEKFIRWGQELTPTEEIRLDIIVDRILNYVS